MSEHPAPGPDVVPVAGHVRLFGFDPVSAIGSIRPRPRSWRIAGAVRTGIATLVLTPVAAIVPPHAPWALGALGVGFVLGRRRLNHRFTLEALEARCPKCDGVLTVRPGQLKTPHTVPCDGCHHEATLELDPDALTALAASTH